MSKRGVYNSLTLAKKVDAIREVERGIKKKCDIAKEYGILPNTLSTYLKNKQKIMDSWNLQDGGARKRIRGGDYPEIDECVIKWIKQSRDSNVPLSGPLIRAKAEEFAGKMKIDSFKASSGWFFGFKDRNDISFKNVCGESASVDNEMAGEWLRGLSNLIADYEPSNIFNVDETGLFFKCLPNKTFTFKGERCSGGKNSKERLTILVGANMDGSEKLPLLMIGKSAKPRCFKDVKSFPVQYKSNKKAWMTAQLFKEWLVTLDTKLFAVNRKILLFIDNCTAHNRTPHLKCIKVVYFPPNMTSVVQPMDQGIIQNLKHYYRRQIVLKILDGIETKSQTKINLLDAGRLLSKAWTQVTPKTISNCFLKAGFSQKENNSEIEDETLEIVNLERWEEVTSDVSYEHYIHVDDNVAVCGELTDGEILEEVLENRTGNPESSEEEEGEIEVAEVPVPTASEASKILENLRRFVEAQPDVKDGIFQSISELEDFVYRVKINKPIQTKITKFFK